MVNAHYFGMSFVFDNWQNLWKWKGNKVAMLVVVVDPTPRWFVLAQNY